MRLSILPLLAALTAFFFAFDAQAQKKSSPPPAKKQTDTLVVNNSASTGGVVVLPLTTETQQAQPANVYVVEDAVVGAPIPVTSKQQEVKKIEQKEQEGKQPEVKKPEDQQPKEPEVKEPKEPEKPEVKEPKEPKKPDVKEPKEPKQPKQPKEQIAYDGPKAIAGISTNLASDLLTALNIGVEVPFGKRWSAHAGYTFPFWRSSDKSTAFVIQHIDLGARYYFKPWEYRSSDVMRGWFLCADLGYANYDVAFKSSGVRGNGFTASFGGGYSWAFNKWWRLDFSASMGMLQAYYDNYQIGQNGEPFVLGNNTSRLPDPTGLKVTLVYLFHTK